jgi:hypothetical protein
MIDLSVITASLAKDRVAQQFARPAAPARAARTPLRRPDRLEPAPRA